MEASDTIKAIVPHYCPNCNQEIFVKIHTTPPVLASVLTRDDIKNAKDDVILRLLASGMSETDVGAIKREIMDEDVMFGPEDVAGIVEQYKK